MPIPQQLLRQHRQTLTAYETLGVRDLVTVWRTVDLTDARTVTALLLPAVRDITAVYGDLAAVQAADFYDEARATAGTARGRFRATAAPVAPADQVNAMVRWAVTPLWSTDPRTGDALKRLAGGTQRLIRKAERDTIFTSGRRDVALARWVRTPQPDACEFCLMLGGRGDVYETQAAATTVVGRDGRVRGSRPLGESYHDNCRCETLPAWSDDDIPDLNRQLAAEWRQVTAGERDQLAAWRKHIAETRPNQHVRRT